MGQPSPMLENTQTWVRALLAAIAIGLTIGPSVSAAPVDRHLSGASIATGSGDLQKPVLIAK